jgi:hypothetical protein
MGYPIIRWSTCVVQGITLKNLKNFITFNWGEMPITKSFFRYTRLTQYIYTNPN